MHAVFVVYTRCTKGSRSVPFVPCYQNVATANQWKSYKVKEA